MEAKEYLDQLKRNDAIIRLAHFAEDTCDGRGQAMIVDKDSQLAVMLEDCGSSDKTGVKAGAIVKYATHPEAEPKIVGTAAYI